MRINTILVASNNAGKLKEISAIFTGCEIKALKDFPKLEEPDENGSTFEENAIIKARYYQKNTGMPALADDSGICIPALGNFPGVRTKRWFDGTDRERNLALIEKVSDLSGKERKIDFITAIAIAIDENTVLTASGKISGVVSTEVRGTNGFGFDEIFELESGKTLAELTDNEKNQISARKEALSKAFAKLQSI